MKNKVRNLILNIVVVIIWQISANILFNKFFERHPNIIYFFIVLFPIISLSINIWILRKKLENKKYNDKALSLSQHSIKNYSDLVRMYIKKIP